MDVLRLHCGRDRRGDLLNRLLDSRRAGRLVVPLVIERIGSRADYAEVLADQVGRVFVQ
jgi:hypothetical protein